MKPYFSRLSFTLACVALSVAYVHAGQDADLATKLKTIETTIDAKRKELHVPGASLVIVKDGKIIYMKGLGYRDQEKKLPVTPNTLFGIGSSSKAFTALEMAMAVDQGLVQWDANPRQYLPYFKLWDKEANEKFTITDLLCHRSGLNRTDLMWIEGRLNREEAIRALADIKPTLPFRGGFQYQNIMFAAAGAVVGKVYNSTWEDITKQRIFKPLGMNDSNTSIDDLVKFPDHATGYSLTEDSSKRTPYRPVVACGPAGSINSNAKDMAKWLEFVMSGTTPEGKRLVSEEGYKAWFSPKTMIAPNTAYALGWFVRQWNGKKLVEHAGNIDGFNAQVGFLPDEHLGMVMLTNVGASSLPGFAMDTIWKTFYGEKKDPRQTNDPQGDPQKEVGNYAAPDIPVKLKVTCKDKTITVTATGQPPLQLENLGGRVYKFAPPAPEGIYITFRPDSKDPKKTEAFLEQGGAKIVFSQEDSNFKADITVDELMKKVIEAQGGEKTLRAVKSMDVESHTVMATQGLTGKISRRLTDGRLSEDVRLFHKDKEVARISQIYDGKHCGALQLGVYTDVEGKALDRLKEEADIQASLNWKKSYSSIKIAGVDKVGKEDVYTLEVIRKTGETVKQYISKKTFLVLKEEGESGFQENFDFRKVNGVVIPFLVRNTNPTTGVTTVFVDRVVINQKVDPKVFDISALKKAAAFK